MHVCCCRDEKHDNEGFVDLRFFCPEKMTNVNHIFKILFALLSAAVVLFIIIYSQNRSTPLTPARNDAETTGQNVPLTNYGPLSNCSLADIKKRPGVVMLTTANLAFVDFVLNMLASVRRAGVCINTTVIAEDQTAYKVLHKYAMGDPAVHVRKTTSGEMDAIEHSRHTVTQYYGIMNKRQAYILALLEQGLEILFTNSDTFWFRNPFPYFEGNFDMFMRGTRSHYPTRRVKETRFCSGFIYLKPTNATVKFMREWVKIMDSNKKWGNYKPDQSVMIRLLQADKPKHVNVKMLDPNLFPWGPEFFNPSWPRKNHSTVVMHAASIHGHANKLTKFQEYGIWLVDVTNLAEDLGKVGHMYAFVLSLVFFLLFTAALCLGSHAGYKLVPYYKY
ncbi:UDP-D-xylose:L-fucose alpha-1,3-D-xylosyltransferase 1-like [Acanthaster planci]|uniref:UDP-D-xylose:L-fucose alpha-1,3-D-xylosyltransferase 1-like n=1 Tax=Acanthaster planci TaxID=133434 RepID=A0A8B7ZDU8_ACAPL|nr:UDP-D-xylose:L-fucose alpha-1,3-D-xylosyltransferase 1-like [Acanthaster planci]